ncbi:uncharacterized protein TNCV_163571 [Trichonephila clavipes]|nr:uncharacterized protein TNCV_163571 [Trichonephila clavipes]
MVAVVIMVMNLCPEIRGFRVLVPPILSCSKSSRWRGGVVCRKCASLDVVLVTWPMLKITNCCSSLGIRVVAAVAEWYRYRIVAGFVTSSSPVPLKTRRVGQRCTLDLSRAETSSHWCGVVVRRRGCQPRCRPRHWTMVQNYAVRRQKPSGI